MKKESSGARAMFMKKETLELCQFCHGSSQSLHWWC